MQREGDIQTDDDHPIAVLPVQRETQSNSDDYRDSPPQSDEVMTDSSTAQVYDDHTTSNSEVDAAMPDDNQTTTTSASEDTSNVEIENDHALREFPQNNDSSSGSEQRRVLQQTQRWTGTADHSPEHVEGQVDEGAMTQTDGAGNTDDDDVMSQSTTNSSISAQMQKMRVQKQQEFLQELPKHLPPGVTSDGGRNASSGYPATEDGEEMESQTNDTSSIRSDAATFGDEDLDENTNKRENDEDGLRQMYPEEVFNHLFPELDNKARAMSDIALCMDNKDFVKQILDTGSNSEKYSLGMSSLLYPELLQENERLYVDSLHALLEGTMGMCSDIMDFSGIKLPGEIKAKVDKPVSTYITFCQNLIMNYIMNTDGGEIEPELLHFCERSFMPWVEAYIHNHEEESGKESPGHMSKHNSKETKRDDQNSDSGDHSVPDEEDGSLPDIARKKIRESMSDGRLEHMPDMISLFMDAEVMDLLKQCDSPDFFTHLMVSLKIPLLYKMYTESESVDDLHIKLSNKISIKSEVSGLGSSPAPIHMAARFNDNPYIIRAMSGPLSTDQWMSLLMISDGKDDEGAGNTALHLAVQYNKSADIVLELLKNLQQQQIISLLRIVDNYGCTPIHGAAGSQHQSAEKVRALLQDLDVGVRMELLCMTSKTLNWTPLHTAAKTSKDPKVIHALVRDLYLEQRVQVLSMKAMDDSTPLHFAAANGVTMIRNMIEELEEQHIAGLLRKYNKHGSTPLHLAAEHKENNIAMMKVLTAAVGREIKKGLLSMKNSKGMTPIEISHKLALASPSKSKREMIMEPLD